jgi:hypothetical protein
MTNYQAPEARRALGRLRRALEKSAAELEALAGALRHAEADDFPADSVAAAEARLHELAAFVEEQAARLDEKILHAGGIEPGRVRRTGGA